nr:polyprotein, putative [Tanacetum cinerariifolium]
MGWLFDTSYIIEKYQECNNVNDLKSQVFYRFIRRTYVWHEVVFAALVYTLGGFTYFGVATSWGFRVKFLVNSDVGHKTTLLSDSLIDFQLKFSLSISGIVTHWFTLIVLSALRRSDNENMLSLVILILRAMIRPAMLYGSECWPITKALAFRVEVAELRMLRWTCGKTMVDMIPNEVFRAALDVDSIIDKMREGRLRWFGHVKRRPQSAPVMRLEAMVVEGSRRRGRPKLRWEDRLKMDMKELCLSEDMTSDRNAWRDRIRISRLVAFLADRSLLWPLRRFRSP